VIAQVVISPNSEVPLVGASGAIAGVLGGYLVLYPGVQVRGIIPLGYYMHRVEWPAFVVLGLWFVMQLFSGVASLGPETGGGGVAFFAHIGGFVLGAVLMGLFVLIVPQPPTEERYEMLYKRARRYPF
jgi:membrane associated rhomboid family serine protease